MAEYQLINNKRKGMSYTTAVIVYMAVCFLCLALALPILNKQVRAQDERLAATISSLIAEKMNYSIRYMTDSAQNMALMLSVQDLSDFEAEYRRLKKTVESADYYSIGLVDGEGNIYGEEIEKAEMAQWRMLETLDSEKEGVTIAEPYRWGRNGQIVFTMFAPFWQNGERAGYIFLTYPLKDIQKMAESRGVMDETEVYLMNAYSDNMIYCAGKNIDRIGTWSNMRLARQNIRFRSEEEYLDWVEGMRNEERRGAIFFTIDDVEYTQVYENVEAMKDWSIVVRIPSNALSGYIYFFQRLMIGAILVLVLASAFLYYLSQKRESTERQLLETLSTRDSLTGLYNRRAFTHMLEKLTETAKEKYMALLFIDIDYFKSVNDTYGHDVGDLLLKEFADLLKRIFSHDDLIARQGGDEFVVCVLSASSRVDMKETMARLHRQLTTIKLDEAKDFQLSFSAGIAEYPSDAADLAGLLRCADEAVYWVKENGRNGFACYGDQGVAEDGKF